ncbi:FtsX-like permease family protein [Streptomyces sp. WAC04114]|uniref:FtsX-like permease family protein n=1 Tax=Streptomyces sp. WAC04114 TaxID=2867961 RepID=UPI001C8BC216|nr:FtsX-like permease family protein [Streptomyces sp. WAC04114]MBX9365727.1 ABC transporter permease [Streptomyces sp. WAC04114]
MTSLRADLRLAWDLTRGSDRGEWWRVTLTAVGAALATGFALAAVALASLRGGHHVPVASGLLNEPGTRSGVIAGLLLLLVPVLGFLGQCARIGAVHRDRRLAGLRLAGATPWQVRRIAALETGLACLLGSAVATVFSVLLLLRLWDRPAPLTWAGIALVAVAVPLLGAAAGAVWLSGAVARTTGRILAVRARSAAVLIAAERLRDDPWAAARTHAAVLLVTIAGGGFMGVRAMILHEVRSGKPLSAGPDYYITGLDLTAAALAVAFAITVSGLAVGTAESLVTRRRGLAAQVAAGVPRAVLGRALLLETALPLAPAVLLAGLGGTAVAASYALLGHGPFPWAAALIPLAIYAACLLAVATSLPLLGRSVRPGELRYV